MQILRIKAAWLAGPLVILFLNAPLSAFAQASEPFAFADFTWMNGNSRQKTFPLVSKYFTGQFTFDGNYVYDFNRPKDHTIGGSSNSGRAQELQVQQLGVGGDFNYENIRGRLMTQFGMYSTMTPAGDASQTRGQWQQDDAYRYLSEAYGGYHWDIWHGINLDVGLFLSYVGLCSYYNFENWVYQMSYVSSNTPWYFNGARIQLFPTDRLKAEIWLVNGWQSYGMYNEAPGVGFQINWRPTGNLSLVTNEYYGADWLGKPDRTRFHSDNSLQYKYYDQPANTISKAAFSVTGDFGCESGGGVSCGKQNFIGFMAYNRIWFNRDKFGLTLGGGRISNPGRYLAIVPPVNGATSSSGAYDFTANAGDPFKAWDASVTFDYMPKESITYRAEYIHRQSDVPYFVGPGGVTPPGGNTGAPGSAVQDFSPDLVKSEDRINLALLIRL